MIMNDESTDELQDGSLSGAFAVVMEVSRLLHQALALQEDERKADEAAKQVREARLGPDPAHHRPTPGEHAQKKLRLGVRDRTGSFTRYAAVLRKT